MTLHVRAPVGTRIEDTAALFDHIEQAIRQVIPPDELVSIVDNIGLPVSGINRAYINTGGDRPDGRRHPDQLNEHHRADGDLCEAAARAAAAEFPGLDLRIPAGRHRQPDPELRRAGADRRAGGRAATRRTMKPMPRSWQAQVVAGPRAGRRAAGAVVTLPRTARRRGPHPRRTNSASPKSDVTNALVTTLAGSFQTAPTFWLDTRERRLLPDRHPEPAVRTSTRSPSSRTCRSPSSKPGGHADSWRHWRPSPATTPTRWCRITTSSPSFDIYAATAGPRPGRAVAGDMQQGAQHNALRTVPKGATVTMRGQVATMNDRFRRARLRPRRARSC